MKPIDIIIAAFFLSHIPITLFVDAQAVLPPSLYPQALKDVMTWYRGTYKDPLMTHLPLWFKSFVWTEVALQLPFFFIGSYAWIARRNWIRIPAIIYGSFVCATMVPILTELACHREPGYDPIAVTAMYAPYLILPATIVGYCALHEKPFAASRAASKGKKA